MKRLVLACIVGVFLLFPSVAFAASPSTTSLVTGGPWIGFYVPGVPSEMTDLVTLESQISAKASVVSFYVSDGESFPWGRAKNAADHGSIPMITIDFSALGTQPVSSITNGASDAYLRTWARNAKDYGQDVWFRPFNEMNGDWAPWYGLKAGNTTADVVAAWRHIKQIFAEEGATNVKFVWSVNAGSVPDTAANAIGKYWPGDDYVDLVAMDGYNWGNTATWASWQSFGQVFGKGYATITALTNKPLIIGETASCEQGGSKASWISNMFQTVPTTYPRIRGVIWFDQNKERDWRVDSSATSLAAFKAGVATWATAPAPTTPTAPTAPTTPKGKVKRVAGPNRYSTAVEISRQSFTSADTVLIATGLDYADALAASPLAGALNAPVLLVPKSWLPQAVSDEILRLGATKAIVAGGGSAVTEGVLRSLQTAGLSVRRISGAGRYATSAALASETLASVGKSSADTVFVTRGDSFADALGVSATAYKQRFPVLLVRPTSLPAETVLALAQIRPARVVIVGGERAISRGVEQALRGLSPDVARVGGGNRYATSAAFAAYSVQQGWAGPGFVGVAAGTQFPDALGGGAATGGQGGVLLLTAPSALPDETRAFLADNAAAVDGVNLFGGELAVQSNVEADVGYVVQ